METKELSDLAKTHVDAIFLHNLTKAEIVMLMAVIQARVNQKLLGDLTPAVPSIPTEVVKPKPLGIRIAEKGAPCVCIMCAKHIYTTNRDVHENSSVGDFIASFTPMPGYKPLTRQTKISNVDNNITTNCPDCNGEFTLYLAGKQIG